MGLYARLVQSSSLVIRHACASMAPRSPTQAFDPTPALEHNRHNYSPLNDTHDMISVDSHFPHASKEVRFSNPPSTTFTRAHSIATDNVPLLPQISSASQIPRQAFRIANPTAGIDINAYIENCRNLNEQLRTAHESERKAWNIERAALKSKIADLEFRLNKSRDSTRRSSEAQSSNGTRSAARSAPNGIEKPIQEPAPPSSLSTPVWKAADHHPPTARIFQNEDVNGNHLPSISEDNHFPLLSKEISPTNNGPPIENVPVPIEKVEPTLDGITLRSAALTSSFVTKITSPQFGSPSLAPTERSKVEPPTFRIDTNSLIPALDEKLRRNAGHTPMNYEAFEASYETSDQPTQVPSPVVEKPLAPAPTTRPPLRPSEFSDSYFSTTSDAEETLDHKPATITKEGESEALFEPEDDVPLKGPLMLDPSAKTDAADAFLSSVDAKLMAAVKEVSPTRRESILSESGEPVTLPVTAVQAAIQAAQRSSPEKNKEFDDDMPRLKLKKSMNFGSAYGSNRPGGW